MPNAQRDTFTQIFDIFSVFDKSHNYVALYSKPDFQYFYYSASRHKAVKSDYRKLE